MLDDVAASIAGPVTLDGVDLEDVASMKIGTSSLDTSVFDLAINNIYRPDECVRGGSPRPQWFPPPPPRRRERTLDARVLFFAPPPLPSPTAAHHRTQHVHPSRPRALRYEAAVALKEDARNDIDLAEAERSQKLTQVRRRRGAPPQRGSSARRAVVRLPRGFVVGVVVVIVVASRLVSVVVRIVTHA
jgi:hypothetical protein